MKRFRFVGVSAATMAAAGRAALEAERARMLAGLDPAGRPGEPLVPFYARIKGRRFPPAVRNARKTGQSLASLDVLEASEGRVAIGTRDPVARRRLGLQRQPMFGASAAGRRAALAVIFSQRFFE